MKINNTYIYKFASNVIFTLKRIFNTIYYVILYKNDFIPVNCWVEQWFGKLQQRNFGDELNIYILESLLGKKVVSTQTIINFKFRDYIFIGSVIDNFSTRFSIIWGGGVIGNCGARTINKPLKVCSVRGELTRDYLLNNGIYCPSIYGDPALLLPLIYNPVVTKKYKYGIIPHVCDFKSPLISELSEKLGDNVNIISFENYGNWHDVIDEIKSCENIFSSSLHGLIISDAYAIPNAMIIVSNNIVGGEFKYKDYFSGINRNYISPIDLNTYNINECFDAIKSYQPIHFDCKSFIQSSPFKLKINAIE